MNYFYLDASAYAKYYYPELGSDVLTALIDALPDAQGRRLVITSMTIAETIAVLNRRRNELQMPDGEYKLVVARLLSDVTGFTYWRVHDSDLLNAIEMVPFHNLNASDALHLHTALRLNDVLHRARQGQVVMVASDQRLLRAADAEGLETINPEESSSRKIQDLIAVD